MQRQVINAVDAGEGDIVVQNLRGRLAANPNDLATRLELAKNYESKGYPELALDHYRIAADRSPKSAEVQLLLARSLAQFGRNKEGVDGLEKFLAANRQTSPVYYAWLGMLYDQTGLLADGEKAHRMALELDANLDYLHNNLGYNLLLQKKNEAASGEFMTALKLNARSEIARNNLGLALAHQPAEAIAHWQSVSGPAAAHTNLAAVFIQQRKYPEARKELDLALGYNRRYPAALENLRIVAELDGKPAVLEMKPVKDSWFRLAMKKLFTGTDSNRIQSSAPAAGAE